jgi:N6-adenosine-specific RNA methylase IME4
MDLDMLMADTCLVGIWITNKPAVRETVLGEHGLFATWGVALVEEWLWLKTTVAGEPVGPLDSAHRKPYEVFLLGRRRRTTTGSAPPPTPPALVVRKVVVAVPDLHSRKPCLKALIDPMVGFAQYRALEIFARHLVAGWWSWGNECVKFNWEGCWCAPHMD